MIKSILIIVDKLKTDLKLPEMTELVYCAVEMRGESEEIIQIAFEDWLSSTCPSGGADLVHRQWEATLAARHVICFRTKDGITHSAVEQPNGWFIRRSVPPFKK